MEYKAKYLVVLAGSPRGGQSTWKSLLKFVVNPLNADLAICTTDNYVENNFLFDKADYKWILKNPKNFEDYYSQYFKGSWKEYLLKGQGLGLFESGLIHFALKDYVFRNHYQELSKYKYIIYTRFDQYYVDFHPDFNDDKIYIPKGEDYFGVCDRHVVFNSNNAPAYFSIIDYIDSEKALIEIPKYPNCESVYKKHLEHSGLEKKILRFNRISFTSALKNDSTNWRIPSYKIFFSKIMIKYPDEFLYAVKNGIKNNLSFNYLINNLSIILYYFYIKFRKKISKTFKKEKKLICEKHGHLFTSSRYNNLIECPECKLIN